MHRIDVRTSESGADLVLRPATKGDAKLLFEWRNDVETREASRNPEPIEEESHWAWLKATLANRKRSLLIAELDSLPVGTVRIDLGSPCEVSWTVAPSMRGKGIGGQMVSQLVRTLDFPVIAVVSAANIASRKIAEAAGFTLAFHDETWMTFRREPGNCGETNE